LARLLVHFGFRASPLACAGPTEADRSDKRKYVRTYDSTGKVILTEYYDLVSDPIENTNLLADGSTANDPPGGGLAALAAKLNAFATCSGTTCIR